MDITPEAAAMAEAWDSRVEREHAQTDRLKDPVETTNAWAGFERRFAPPRRDSPDLDPAVPVVEEYLRPEDAVLDIGAGGGRLAVPLAASCRRVTAVEPADSMLEQLQAAIADSGADNVEAVASTWEDADVEPADIVICSHVLYSVTPIMPFVQKMANHARRRVFVMLREQPPQANFYPLFEKVFGEERIWLPAMPDFRAFLEALGVEYEERKLENRPHGVFKDYETALDMATRRLFLQPGSENARRLESVLPECVEPDPKRGGVRFKWAKPQDGRLVTWATGDA